jgi:serine acetyltransferase
LGSAEIHYGSSIGKGLKILHPSLGIVISKHAVIGERCTFTGGNCIGSRKSADVGIIMGDDVTVGANAVIVGPVRIGEGVVVTAGSVVIRDVGDWEVVGGVPAKRLMLSRSAPAGRVVTAVAAHGRG